MRTITFNSYDLQTSTIVTTNFYGLDEDIDFSHRLEALSSEDGSVIIESRHNTRTISISGVVIGTSQADLESKIDTLKQNLITTTIANLDIGYAGGTRRWQAKLESLKIQRETGMGSTRAFTIDFICLSHIGTATSTTSQAYNNETTANSAISKTYTFTGTAYPKPIITIEVDSCTALTKIAIKNTTTNTEMSVTATYAAGSTLVIDTENKTVQIEGVSVAWDGVFPQFNQGGNTVTFTFTATAHQSDITYTYYPRYF